MDSNLSHWVWGAGSNASQRHQILAPDTGWGEYLKESETIVIIIILLEGEWSPLTELIYLQI